MTNSTKYPIRKINKRAENVIHYKGSDDEWWMECDSNGNEIHTEYADGYEEWYEYDDNGKCICYKDSNGVEEYYD